MPQTEILIQLVLDGEHTIDAEAQGKIHGAAVSAMAQALDGGVLTSRTSIEVRAVPDEAPAAAPVEPAPADAAQPPAPAPVEAAPSPGDVPIPGEHPAPHAPPQAAPHHPTT